MTGLNVDQTCLRKASKIFCVVGQFIGCPCGATPVASRFWHEGHIASAD